MLFEVATPRRQSQQANAVVKGKNLSLSGSLREHLVRSFDGGVSFIMSLHSTLKWFQYSFFTMTMTGFLSGVIITFTFQKCSFLF